MDKLARKRISQLFQFGWPQSKQIAKEEGVSRLSVFKDMLISYKKYHLWSNQYKKENWYKLSENERKEKGEKYKTSNDERDSWIRDKQDNRRFLYKYTTRVWELNEKKDKARYQAYAKRYNIGKGGIISTNVVIERNHFLNGSISIGDDVLLAKNVYIDYSGNVVLCDDVKLSNGVTIESHAHEFVPGSTEYKAIPTSVFIEDGVWVGQHAVICESVKKIGRCAQIGAGAVVRNSIPPYAIVIGNPAKIVGFVFTSEQVKVFEKQHFPDNPIDLEKYEADYQKYFINKMNEIKQYIKL